MSTQEERSQDILIAVGVEVSRLENQISKIKHLLELSDKEQSDQGMTMDKFEKLSVSDQLKWKAENPAAYREMVS